MNKTHEAWLGQLSFSVTPILQYVHRGIRDYTTHGAEHSREVELIGRNVLKKCNSKARRCNTTSYEEYLVLASAWLHDLGNVLGRDKHNETSCKIIDQLGARFIWGLEPNAINLIKWICYAHSVDVPIDSVQETLKVEGAVNLRFLAALFRLLDASDIANKRAPLPVFELIKDQIDLDTAKHWKSHQAIMDVFYPDDSDVIWITVIDESEAEFAVNAFDHKFESVKDTLLSYEFPWKTYRLQKIDKVPI